MSDELELDQPYINKIKKIIEHYVQDGAVFAGYLDSGLICKAEKAAYVALLYPEEFDVYFTKCGWEGGGDYIITKHSTPIERVYDQLMNGDEEASEEYPYDTFIYDVYKLDENGIAEPKSIGEIKASQKDGLFLDEAVNSNKVKQKYTYAGPVFRFNDVYRTYWEDETEAVSAQKALNNLTSKFKTKNGFKQNTDFTLDPDYLLCDDESINAEQPASYCDKCGTQLNDGGTCPVCDDGETDY